MKAPDKIYVREYQDGDYTTWWDEKPHEEKSIGMKAVCYIRKDALIEKISELRAIPHDNAIARDNAFVEIINIINSIK